MLVLALLWWAWTGYAWLTSVVDPEEGAVRIAMIAAMAAMLLVALAVPDAFGDGARVRAGVRRRPRRARRPVPARRAATTEAARSVARPVGGDRRRRRLLIVGALLGGTGQVVLWTLALALDMGGPYFARAAGWRLVPGTSRSATG